MHERPNALAGTDPVVAKVLSQRSLRRGARATEGVARAVSQPGRPLERGLQTEFAGRFGRDFGHVRVHSDGTAASSAAALGADAYTVGRSVLFGAGRYQPQTEPGRRLIAHELAHVVQQNRYDTPAVGGLSVDPSASAETEADRAADPGGERGASAGTDTPGATAMDTPSGNMRPSAIGSATPGSAATGGPGAIGALATGAIQRQTTPDSETKPKPAAKPADPAPARTPVPPSTRSTPPVSPGRPDRTHPLGKFELTPPVVPGVTTMPPLKLPEYDWRSHTADAPPASAGAGGPGPGTAGPRAEVTPSVPPASAAGPKADTANKHNWLKAGLERDPLLRSMPPWMRKAAIDGLKDVDTAAVGGAIGALPIPEPYRSALKAAAQAALMLGKGETPKPPPSPERQPAWMDQPPLPAAPGQVIFPGPTLHF